MRDLFWVDFQSKRECLELFRSQECKCTRAIVLGMQTFPILKH